MEFFVVSVIKALVVAAVLMTTLAYLQWVERKVIAHIQARLGPSRVGPHGLLQPLADVIKLFTKEDLLPPYVNKFFYLLAPFLAVTMALISISVIPFGSQVTIFGHTTWMQLTDLNVGVLFILALSSLGVYGIALAGWASNNKYSLLGGLRSSAQLISYELPLSLAVAAPLLLANTLSLRQIVEAQSGFYFGFLPRWHIFQGPMPQIFSFVIFMIAGFAETNRVPFDLPEAETELVAGFHTEYSSMKFALFFLAEYVNMFTVSMLATTLFLGGWNGPFVHQLPWLGVFYFLGKVILFLFLYIWLRGTLPRFRFDQLMIFGWKYLVPTAIVNIVITATIEWSGLFDLVSKYIKVSTGWLG